MLNSSMALDNSLRILGHRFMGFFSVPSIMDNAVCFKHVKPCLLLTSTKTIKQKALFDLA